MAGRASAATFCMYWHASFARCVMPSLTHIRIVLSISAVRDISKTIGLRNCALISSMIVWDGKTLFSYPSKSSGIFPFLYGLVSKLRVAEGGMDHEIARLCVTRSKSFFAAVSLEFETRDIFYEITGCLTWFIQITAFRNFAWSFPWNSAFHFFKVSRNVIDQCLLGDS